MPNKFTTSGASDYTMSNMNAPDGNFGNAFNNNDGSCGTLKLKGAIGGASGSITYYGFNFTAIPDAAVIVKATLLYKFRMYGGLTNVNMTKCKVNSLKLYSGNAVSGTIAYNQAYGDLGQSTANGAGPIMEKSQEYPNNNVNMFLTGAKINKLYYSADKSGLAWEIGYNNLAVGSYDSDVYFAKTMIEWYLPANGIIVTPTSLTMDINDKPIQLSAIKNPGISTDDIVWSSSNAAIAAVTGAGLVTPKAMGTATVTAKTESGKTATCAVTVTETVTVSHNPVTNGSISPGAGAYSKGDKKTFTFSADTGYVLESVIIGNEIITEFQNPSQYSREITLNANITLGVTVVPRFPVVAQAHTREKISDKPGYEKSVVAYSSDMDYTEYEIRRTIKGAARGRGVGELLDSGSVNVAAGAETVFEAHYHHLVTDGDYIISVYVKNNYGIWS